MQADAKWFRAKLFGLGWYPISWQGWLLTIIYDAAIVGFIVRADIASHSVSDALLSFAVPFLVLSVLYLAICYATGELPVWKRS